MSLAPRSPSPSAGSRSAWPDDVEVGEVVPSQYFGRHLVVWRDDDGVAHVKDAFCPHLGAHLGHGGIGRRRASSMCPFHGWRFDGEGANTLHPLQRAHQQEAKLRTYPTIERNGLVMVWYHPDGDVEPMWEIPELPEFDADPTSSPSGDPRLHGRRRRGRSWPRTGRLRPLPLRAQHRDRARARVVRDRRHRRHDAIDPEVPHAPRRGRRTHRRRQLRPRLRRHPLLAASSTPFLMGCNTPDRRRAAATCASTSRCASSATTRRDLERGQGLRRRGRQAGPGGQPDLGEQGPPGPPGAGRHRRPVHEVPQVGRQFYAEGVDDSSARCTNRRTSYPAAPLEYGFAPVRLRPLPERSRRLRAPGSALARGTAT